MRINSVADALAAMDYLHKRELLCERCAIQLATVANPNHAYCDGCRPAHGEYRNITAPNRLEQGLCEAVRVWLEAADAS